MKNNFPLLLALLIPTAGHIHLQLGPLPAVATFVVGGIMLHFWLNHDRLHSLCEGGLGKQTAGAAILLSFLLFALLFPQLDNNNQGGSDRDEALDLAVSALLSGEYPYSPRTQFDNPISPLPGAILLAVPFWMLGTSALQNLFWLTIFAYTMTQFKNGRFLILALLLFSAAFWHELLTGGDLLANALYTTLALLWFTEIMPTNQPRWQKITAALFFGLALASRPNFWFLLPLAWRACLPTPIMKMNQHTNFIPVTIYTTLTALTTSTLIAAFYFWNPAQFSPFHTASEIGVFNTVVPRADQLIIGATTLLTLYFLYRGIPSRRNLFYAAGTIIALPILLGIGFTTIAVRFPDFRFAALFGIMCVPFFLFATAENKLADLPDPH